MLDAEFIAAYCHGIVVTCYDGIQRRFYPRILTYSADYPEKQVFNLLDNIVSNASRQDTHRQHQESWHIPLPKV